MGLNWSYEVLPAPADFSTALSRFRNFLGRGAPGHGSWVEFSTDGVEEILQAYELAGLPTTDPVGVTWKSSGTGDKAREAEQIAQALVGLDLQEEEGRLARTMRIHGRFVSAPKPATADDQEVAFLHNRYWKASTGVSWVHRGKLPRVRARWDVFRRAFHELNLDRQWENAKGYLQEGVAAASRRAGARTEPVLEGIRVKGMGWDRFGAMNFFLTPPRATMAVSMFGTLRSKMLAEVYSYVVSVGGTPSDIQDFARQHIGAGHVASFLGSRDLAFADPEVRRLNDLSRSFKVAQPLSLEFGEETYSFDLSLAKRNSAYHIGLHHEGRDIKPVIDRIQADWDVEVKLLEVG